MQICNYEYEHTHVYIHIYVLGVHMHICMYMFYIDIYIHMCVYMGFSVLEIRCGQLEIVQGSKAPPATSGRKGLGAVDSIEF